MHSTLYIIIGALYFQIGRLIGAWSWKRWHAKNSNTLAAKFLFPVKFLFPIESRGDPSLHHDHRQPIDGFVEKENYEFLMAFVWPLKIMWSLTFVLMVLGWFAMKAIVNPGIAFTNMAEWWQKRMAGSANKTNVRIEYEVEHHPLEVKWQRVEELTKKIAELTQEKTTLEAEIELANGYRGASPVQRQAQAAK